MIFFHLRLLLIWDRLLVWRVGLSKMPFLVLSSLNLSSSCGHSYSLGTFPCVSLTVFRRHSFLCVLHLLWFSKSFHPFFFLQGSLCPEGRELVKISHSELSVPKFLTLYTLNCFHVTLKHNILLLVFMVTWSLFNALYILSNFNLSHNLSKLSSL